MKIVIGTRFISLEIIYTKLNFLINPVKLAISIFNYPKEICFTVIFRFFTIDLTIDLCIAKPKMKRKGVLYGDLRN